MAGNPMDEYTFKSNGDENVRDRMQSEIRSAIQARLAARAS
jgi:hypothetical protein